MEKTMKEIDIGLTDWKLELDERSKEMNVFTLTDLISNSKVLLDLDDMEEIMNVIKFIKSYYKNE